MSGSGEPPFLACRWPSPLMAGRESRRELPPVSSSQGTGPIMRSPPSEPHPAPVTSRRPHLLIPSHWGLELQHRNCGRDTNIQCIRVMFYKVLPPVCSNLLGVSSGTSKLKYSPCRYRDTKGKRHPSQMPQGSLSCTC